MKRDAADQPGSHPKTQLAAIPGPGNTGSAEQPDGFRTGSGTAATDAHDAAGTSQSGVRHHPALPAVVALSVGILVDRPGTLNWTSWLTLASAFGLASMVSFRRGPTPGAAQQALGLRHTVTTVFILVFWFALGGSRHHQFWLVRADNDISLFAGTDRQPVVVRGRIVTRPAIHRRYDNAEERGRPLAERTTCVVECRRLLTAGGLVPVTGLARLTLSGHLTHASVGDSVCIHGQLSKPLPAGNPGEFDFAAWLRRQGVRCIIHCTWPDAVEVERESHGRSLRRWTGRLRDHCEFVLAHHLGRDTLPAASALLLGSRDMLSDADRMKFAESGTMHLLAISGLHVGILGLLIWYLCRVIGVSLRVTCCSVIAVTLLYSLITDGRPPVVRATVLIALVAGGLPWYRTIRLPNALCIAGMLILLWNPTDLFDPGAQLSFLAVAAIAWAQPGALRRNPNDPDPLRTDSVEFTGRASRITAQLVVRLRDHLKSVYVLMAAIWLLTAPVVAAQFHLVSPVGLVINVVLIDCMLLIRGAGFGLLMTGLLLPPLAAVFAIPFEFGLECMLGLVRLAADMGAGHRYVAGPAWWWLIGYYAIVIPVPAGLIRFRRALLLLLLWCTAGLTVGLKARDSSDMRCTFLAVGHGCAILLESPAGDALLVDAGALDGSRRAQSIVQRALWTAGRTSLNAIAVTHADVDHFNAVPGLMRSVAVGCLIVGPGFLDAAQPAVVSLCETAWRRRIPIRTIGSDDHLVIDPRIRIRVLHPEPDFHRRGTSDNARSLVLLVEYAGIRLLLTGDLEDEGLDRLLALPPVDVDVLLAPHHGSANVNHAALARWAQPEWVVVSTGHGNRSTLLANDYGPETNVLSTAEVGAVDVIVSPDGRLAVQSWRDQQIDGGEFTQQD